MSHFIRKPVFCKCENKDADQLRNNFAADQLLCFCYIVLSFFYHNPKFEDSNHLLWLHSLICVGSVWKPRSSVPKTGFLMSRLKIQHVKLFLLFMLHRLIRITLAMIKLIVILKQTGHLLLTTPIKWIYYTLGS